MRVKVVLLTMLAFILSFTFAYANELERQTDIELDKIWKVEMNQKIVESSVTGKVRVFEGQKEVRIKTSVVDHFIYVHPLENYKPSTEYVLSIGPGITSTVGKELKNESRMSFRTINKQDGSESDGYTHTFESNYDFDWKYNKGDYSQFRLDGVKDGQIVAGYTTDKNNDYGFAINIGDEREKITKVLGEPLEFIRKGNTRYILSDQDLLPTYLIGDKYVKFIIDQHAGNKVRSILWIDKETEERAAYWYKPNSDRYKKDSEELMYELVNQARHAEGLPVLKKNEILETAARKHSDDMARNNYFSHINLKGEDPSKRAEKEGLRPNATGENISYGYQSIILSHEGLMNSIGHRNNILSNRYYQLGIGLAFNGQSSPYVTQKFYVYE